MPQTLDFNKVVYDTITIKKGDQTFILRDDVPMVVLVRVFGLQAMGERIKSETAKLDPETASAQEAQLVIERAFHDSEAEALDIFGQLVRHTPAYRDVQDEELATLFTYEEQGAIINAFFTHRLGALSAPSPATNDGGEAVKTPTEAEQGEMDGITEMAQALGSNGNKSRSHPASRKTTSPVGTRPM